MTSSEIKIKQRYDRYGKLVKLYNALGQLIAELKRSGGLNGIDYEAVRIDGGIKVSIEERVLRQVEKYEEMKDDALDEVFAIGDEITRSLKLLTEDERIVVIYRHLQGLPWKEIPEKIHYSERKVALLYASAISKIATAQKESVGK